MDATCLCNLVQFQKKRKINVKIEGEKWQKALDKAFEKANKKAKIDGFRPGKAPKEMFIKKYGIESLFMDAGDLVLEALKKNVKKNTYGFVKWQKVKKSPKLKKILPTISENQ